MPTHPNRNPRTVRRTRRRPPKRGFGRLVAFLLIVLVVELAWRSGWMSPTGNKTAHLAASPVAAGERQPLAGPPVASAEETGSTLDRLISLGYPVFCGGGTKPLVALTFDDGPGPYTQETVDILKRAGARATFFIVGRELVDWPNLTDMPKTEATVGAIGDHTWDHADLLGATQGDLDHEMAYSQQFIAQHAETEVRLFRPPYGHHDDAVDQEAKGLGMLEVLWSVDSRDGTGDTGDEVLANVLAGVGPGAIVLMHENRGTTLRILPQLLDEIRARGLHTVTVPELLAADPPSMAQLQSGTCH